MSNRFKMSFGQNPPIYKNPPSNSNSNLGTIRPPVNKSMPLNSSMIDRVHKAKPGCSACGKKVA